MYNSCVRCFEWKTVKLMVVPLSNWTIELGIFIFGHFTNQANGKSVIHIVIYTYRFPAGWIDWLLYKTCRTIEPAEQKRKKSHVWKAQNIVFIFITLGNAIFQLNWNWFFGNVVGRRVSNDLNSICDLIKSVSSIFNFILCLLRSTCLSFFEHRASDANIVSIASKIVFFSFFFKFVLILSYLKLYFTSNKRRSQFLSEFRMSFGVNLI